MKLPEPNDRDWRQYLDTAMQEAFARIVGQQTPVLKGNTDIHNPEDE